MFLKVLTERRTRIFVEVDTEQIHTSSDQERRRRVTESAVPPPPADEMETLYEPLCTYVVRQSSQSLV